MSTLANLLLDNSEIEEVDLENTHYSETELKSFAHRKCFYCGGQNNDGDLCEARVTVKKHKNGHLFFSKFPNARYEHIQNCDRQNVVIYNISRTSIDKYKEFLNNLFNGIYNENEGHNYISTTGVQHGEEHNGRNTSSINLKKIENLIRAIANDNVSLEMEISDTLILLNFFKSISKESSLQRFMSESNRNRYYYIIFTNVKVAQNNNLYVNLKQEDNSTIKLFLNHDLSRQFNENKHYSVVVIAKPSDFQYVPNTLNRGECYKIRLNDNRFISRIQNNNNVIMKVKSKAISLLRSSNN